MEHEEEGSNGLVPETRGTEVDGKGEGSLSISIVPIERWEICSRKATE
jgi:hypothetical protein